MQDRNKQYLTQVQATVQTLIDSGKIIASMSETQKAQVIFDWVTENVSYDYENYNKKESGAEYDKKCYTGYAAIVDKTSVCNGYTALYNLMCRFVGLYDTYSMIGSSDQIAVNHIWTVQILDGKKCMSDATWGSNYFAKSADYFSKDHYWKIADYPEWNNAQGIN
jgi:transglutaminase/protease-like cytokinesis protein 3